MRESLGDVRGRISRRRGTGRLPPSLARREAALRSRASSHPRRLADGFSDGRSRHAPTTLTRTSRIAWHEVDAESSLRAPSGIAEVGMLTRRLAAGTTPAACVTPRSGSMDARRTLDHSATGRGTSGSDAWNFWQTSLSAARRPRVPPPLPAGAAGSSGSCRTSSTAHFPATHCRPAISGCRARTG